MAVKIRLRRAGRKKVPHYAIIVSDSRNPRDGKFIEKLGFYNPLLPGKLVEKAVFSNIERAKYWISVGAQPTEKVALFLKHAGVLG